MLFVLLAQNKLLDQLSRNWPQFAMLAGLALVCFIVLRNGAQSRRRESSPSDADELREHTGQRSRDSALADAPDEVLRWQVEMHEIARDLKAELDTKLLALQALIREARAERERLEATLERAERAKT